MVSRLVARGVTFEYSGPIRAVDGVDLELRPGELLCVLGPNGSGKSTLVALLAGLLRPSIGSVTLDGGEVSRWTPRQRARRIALVPQNLRALPDVTVRDFVHAGRYGHLGFLRRSGTADAEAVRRAMRDADIDELGERLLTELSGGQRQRVLVARALAQEADLLLVDEPTNSLDPEHQLAVFDLLARLCCEGRGALVVTHDLNLASQFASGIALLREGRVAARGTAEEVLRPEVLAPVYGEHLRYGKFPAPRGGGERPFVVPWLGGEEQASPTGGVPPVAR